jgi:uncharacterized protein with FMN-binding domain
MNKQLCCEEDENMKWVKWLVLSGILVGIGILVSCSIINNLEEEMDHFVKTGIITTPDLHNIHDGEYTGSYRSGIVMAKVRVSVQDQDIKTISILKHFNGQGSNAEVILDDVIEAQSLEVDAVSGATISSKVILKAIEIALTKE